MGENSTAQLDSWLVRIRNGDDAAFNELLRHFERRLEALASKMLKGFPEVAARADRRRAPGGDASPRPGFAIVGKTRRQTR